MLANVRSLLIVMLAVTVSMILFSRSLVAAESSRPNIVLILADDKYVNYAHQTTDGCENAVKYRLEANFFG